MKLQIYLIISILSYFNLFGQEAVISEYFNASDVEDEWTEIVIVEDNVDLRNYILRDNGANYFRGNNWNGGIKFTNAGLWNNLRSGTVIVINHRGNTVQDDNPTDGFIEISAENTSYFQKKNWSNESLSIQNSGDIVQLLNSSGQNVHSLGHVTQLSGDFNDISGNKFAYYDKLDEGFSISISVENIENYSLPNTGIDTGKSLSGLKQNGTKGTANVVNGKEVINFLLWQSLREPVFNNANLSFNGTEEGIELSWTMTEDESPNEYDGYIIIKGPGNSDNICKPQDGTEYDFGDIICSNREVVAVLNGRENISFIDKNYICGNRTRYSVFAYRFKNKLNESWEPQQGRGYAYTEVFDSTLVFLEKPEDFEIFSTKGLKFCNMDTTIMYSNIPRELAEIYDFAWYKKEGNSETILIDFRDPFQKDSIKVYRTGQYRLEARSKDGCITSSDYVSIEVIDNPDAYIANQDDYIFENDTTIYFCEELSYTFKANFRNEDPKTIIFLYRDGQRINPLGNPYTITQPGDYYYIFNIDDCIDTSSVVSFESRSVDIVTNVNNLDFILNASQNSIVKSFNLINNSDNEIIYNEVDIELNPPYSIENTFPIKVPANGQEQVDIRFAPPNDGLFYDTLKLYTICNTRNQVVLNGRKLLSNNGVIASLDTIDFGPILQCRDNNVDSTFVITNIGQDTVTLGSINDGANFYTIPDVENIKLAPGENLEITVGTNYKQVSVLNHLLEIPWETANDEGVVNLRLLAIIDIPSFVTNKDTINFGRKSDCELPVYDTLEVVNTGLFQINFEEDRFKFENMSFANTPVNLKPGDTMDIIIEINPKSIGVINDFITISPLPWCTNSEYLTLQGEKIDGGYSVTYDDIIDIGNIYTCSDTVISIPIELRISTETNPDLSDIINTTDSRISITGLKEGEISSGYTFNIEINNSTPGIINDSVSFTLNPCNKKVKINVKGDIKDVDIFSITPDTEEIEFLAVTDGVITLVNNNEDPIVLNSIEQFDPFYFNPQPNFPITIQPKDTLELNYEVVGSKVGEIKSNFQYNISEPCDISLEDSVKVNVKEGELDPGNLLFNLSEELISLPKKNISYSINLEEIDYNFEEIGANSIELKLKYPLNALEYKGSSNKINADYSITRNLDILTISVSSDNALKLMNTLVDLNFLVLDGKPGIYPLSIQSIEIESYPEINGIIGDASSIEILDNCVNTRDYGFANPPVMTFDDNDRVVNVFIHQPTSDAYYLRVYDINGQIVKEYLNGSQGTGDYYIEINKDNLNSGVYFIEFTFPGNSVVRKFLNIK